MERRRSLLPGLILILLGAYFLVANVLGIGGSSILIALGVAFLGGYAWTNRYGLLIAGAILTAIGVFAVLQETRALVQNDGAWFFVILGLGFLAIYLLGRRWSRWWPLAPGFVLIAVGLFVVYAAALPITWQQWLDVARWWPLALVLLGVWLFLRHYLPVEVRRAVGAFLVIVILSAGALLAVSAGAATAGGQGFRLSPGWGPEFTQKVEREVDAPIEGQLVVTSSVGSITVRPTEGRVVKVIATKHVFAPNDEQGQQKLEEVAVEVDRQGNEVQISASLPETSERGVFLVFGRSAWVDYEIYAPPALGLRTVTSTGDTNIEGIKAGIEARTSTGGIRMQDVAGAINAETSTGNISFSGSISHDSTLRTSTGEVRVIVAPQSALDLEAQSTTGTIEADLPIQIERQDAHSLRGAINGGGPRLQIRSSTGNVRISQGQGM